MSMLHTALLVVLVLNILWFSVAFYGFSLKPSTAAKVLVPKSSPD